MSSYSTVVVGTDGSDTSMAAVDRAAALAADAGAKLVIACAYFPASDRETAHDRDVLGDEAYQVVGSAPAEDTLRTARDRAAAAGAKNVETPRCRASRPRPCARSSGSAGRPARRRQPRPEQHRRTDPRLGPLDVARHAGIDVLIVHTT